MERDTGRLRVKAKPVVATASHTQYTASARDSFLDECYTAGVGAITPHAMYDQEALDTCVELLAHVGTCVTSVTDWRKRISDNNINPMFLGPLYPTPGTAICTVEDVRVLAGAVSAQTRNVPTSDDIPVPRMFRSDDYYTEHDFAPVRSILDTHALETIVYFPWSLYVRTSRKHMSWENARNYMWMLRYYHNFVRWTLDLNARLVFRNPVYVALLRQIVRNIGTQHADLEAPLQRFVAHCLPGESKK